METIKKQDKEKAVENTMKNIIELGFDAHISQESCNGSVYIDVFDKGKIMFTLRISDHQLTHWNQMPAGVINTMDPPFFCEISKEEIVDYVEEVNNMTEKQKDYLWSNRYINNDGEVVEEEDDDDENSNDDNNKFVSVLEN